MKDAEALAHRLCAELGNEPHDLNSPGRWCRDCYTLTEALKLAYSTGYQDGMMGYRDGMKEAVERVKGHA